MQKLYCVLHFCKQPSDAEGVHIVSNIHESCLYLCMMMIVIIWLLRMDKLSSYWVYIRHQGINTRAQRLIFIVRQYMKVLTLC